MPVEASGRMTSLACFVLSAVLLFKICRTFLQSSTAVAVTGIFLFCSLNLEYGSSVLIEYAAILFALASFYLALIYVGRAKTELLLLFGLTTALSSLVKVTTSLLWIFIGVPVFLLVRRAKPRVVVKLLSFALIGHMPAFFWTKWADYQKSKSVFTDWLTSGNLMGWNFGTVRQRLFYFDWERSMLNEFFPSVLGGTVFATAILIIALVFGINRRVVYGSMVIFLSGPLIFTNLYFVHNYYWVAVLPAFLFIVGVAFEAVEDFIRTQFKTENVRLALLRTLVAAALVIASWFSTSGKRHFDVFAKPGSIAYNDEQVEVAVVTLRRFTSKTDSIVILGDDWNPRILYFSDRRGLMVPRNMDISEISSVINQKMDYRYVYFFASREVSLEEAQNIFGFNVVPVAANLFKLLMN